MLIGHHKILALRTWYLCEIPGLVQKRAHVQLFLAWSLHCGDVEGPGLNPRALVSLEYFLCDALEKVGIGELVADTPWRAVLVATTRLRYDTTPKG